MDISRRKLLGWTAMAPLAAAAEAVVGITGKAAGMGGPATASDLARQRIEADKDIIHHARMTHDDTFLGQIIEELLHQRSELGLA